MSYFKQYEEYRKKPTAEEERELDEVKRQVQDQEEAEIKKIEEQVWLDRQSEINASVQRAEDNAKKRIKERGNRTFFERIGGSFGRFSESEQKEIQKEKEKARQEMENEITREAKQAGENRKAQLQAHKDRILTDPMYRPFRWEDGKLLNGDLEQEKIAQLALKRAEIADQGDEYSHSSGLAQKYWGVDPRGKVTELEMDIAYRVEQLKQALPDCSEKEKAVLNRFLQSSFFEELRKDKRREDIRKLQEASKHCWNEIVSVKIQNLAKQKEEEWKENLGEKFRILEIMERIAGRAAYVLKPEEKALCSRYVGEELMEKLETTRTAQGADLNALRIRIPDDETVGRILLQQAIADPKNLGALIEDVSVENEEEAKQEYLLQYINATAEAVIKKALRSQGKDLDEEKWNREKTNSGTNLGKRQGMTNSEMLADAWKDKKPVELLVPVSGGASEKVRICWELPKLNEVWLFDQYKDMRMEMNEETRNHLEQIKKKCKGMMRNRRIFWEEKGRAESNDELVDAYLENAYKAAKAAYAYQDGDVPHFRNLATAFPGVDPSGKLCRLDMGFAQRMDRIDIEMAMCDKSTQEILKAIIGSDRFKEMHAKVSDFCRKIQTLNDMAKFCQNMSISLELQAMADDWENNAFQNNRNVQELNEIYTILERLSGPETGRLSKDQIDLVKKYDSSINLPPQMKTGRNGNRVGLKALEIKAPSMTKINRILMQEEGELPIELAAKDKALSDRENVAYQCVILKTQSVLDAYFRPIEQKLVGKRTSKNSNRGTEVYFKGKSVSEIMEDTFKHLNGFEELELCTTKPNSGKDSKNVSPLSVSEKKTEVSLDDWHDACLNNVCTRIVYAAMREGSPVEIRGNTVKSAKNEGIPIRLVVPPAESVFDRYAPSQPPLTEAQKGWVKQARKDAKENAMNVDGPQEKTIIWSEDNELIASDVMDRVYIRIANERVAAWGKTAICPGRDLGKKFAGVQPFGKCSLVQMDIARRKQNLIWRLMTHKGSKGNLVRKILSSEAMKGYYQNEKIIDYCQKIWKVRELSKACPNEATSRRLERFANTLEEEARQRCPEIQEVYQMLTVAEQLLNPKLGEIKEEDVAVCRRNIPEWPKDDRKILEDKSVQRDVPEKIQITVPSKESLALHAAMADPQNLTKSLDAITRKNMKKNVETYEKKWYRDLCRRVLETLLNGTLDEKKLLIDGNPADDLIDKQIPSHLKKHTGGGKNKDQYSPKREEILLDLMAEAARDGKEVTVTVGDNFMGKNNATLVFTELQNPYPVKKWLDDTADMAAIEEMTDKMCKLKQQFENGGELTQEKAPPVKPALAQGAMGNK